MIIDGHGVEPLPNGSYFITTDGVKTYHSDEAAALRHVERMATERAQYEVRRMMEGRQ